MNIPIPISDNQEEEAADFNEKDISEKETANSSSVLSALHKAFVPSGSIFDVSKRNPTRRPMSSRSIFERIQPMKTRRFTGNNEKTTEILDKNSPVFGTKAQNTKEIQTGVISCPFEVSTPLQSAPSPYIVSNLDEKDSSEKEIKGNIRKLSMPNNNLESFGHSNYLRKAIITPPQIHPSQQNILRKFSELEEIKEIKENANLINIIPKITQSNEKQQMNTKQIQSRKSGL